MDSFRSSISIIFLLFVVGHAALSPQQLYWNSVLPNTPMPSAISDLLPGTSNTKVSSNPQSQSNIEWNPPGTSSTKVSSNPQSQSNIEWNPPEIGTKVSYNPQSSVNIRWRPPEIGTKVSYNPQSSVNIRWGPPDIGTKVSYNPQSSVNIRWRPPEMGTKVSYNPQSSINRRWGPPGTQGETIPHSVFKHSGNKHQHDFSGALFFLEKDLQTGAKMNVGFTKAVSQVPFITRKKAEMFPFSSSKISQILKQFSIMPESDEAVRIKRTIEDCEAPPIAGEKKYCATSLESMVEFSMSSLGTKKVKVLSTSISKEDSALQSYTITNVKLETMAENTQVVCHPVDYMYAVFYCHLTTSKAYTVEMNGDDGKKVKAAAICHTNTKEWSPDHLSFKVLKVKPGTVPICHFMPPDNIIWSG